MVLNYLMRVQHKSGYFIVTNYRHKSFRDRSSSARNLIGRACSAVKLFLRNAPKKKNAQALLEKLSKAGLSPDIPVNESDWDIRIIAKITDDDHVFDARANYLVDCRNSERDREHCLSLL